MQRLVITQSHWYVNTLYDLNVVVWWLSESAITAKPEHFHGYRVWLCKGLATTESHQDVIVKGVSNLNTYMKFDEVTKYKTRTLLLYCKIQKAGWGQWLKFGLKEKMSTWRSHMVDHKKRITNTNLLAFSVKIDKNMPTIQTLFE